jgi:hypothetical protein
MNRDRTCSKAQLPREKQGNDSTVDARLCPCRKIKRVPPLGRRPNQNGSLSVCLVTCRASTQRDCGCIEVQQSDSVG